MTNPGLRALFVLVTVAAMSAVGLVVVLFWVAVAVWRFYLWTAQGYCWRWQLPERERRAIMWEPPTEYMEYEAALEYVRRHDVFRGLLTSQTGSVVATYLAGGYDSDVERFESRLNYELNLNYEWPGKGAR